MGRNASSRPTVKTLSRGAGLALAPACGVGAGSRHARSDVLVISCARQRFGAITQTAQRVIVLMDSRSPGKNSTTTVTKDAGDTNADDVSAALRDSPAGLDKENTSSILGS